MRWASRLDPLVSFPDEATPPGPRRMPPDARAIHPSPMCGCTERGLTGCQGSMLPLYSVRHEPHTVRLVCDTCWAWNDVSRLPPSQATPRVLLAPTHGPPLLWTRRHGCPRCGGTGGYAALSDRIHIRVACLCGQIYHEHVVGDPTRVCADRAMRPGPADGVGLGPDHERCRGYYCTACGSMAAVDGWPRWGAWAGVGGPVVTASCGKHTVTGSRLALLGWSSAGCTDPDPDGRPSRWP